MSGISLIRRDWGDAVGIVRIVAANTLSQVGAANYLLNQADNIAAINGGPFEWQASDMVLVYATDGWGFYTVASPYDSLTAFAMSPDVVGAPVTIGDFAVFQSTSGNLEDLGYLPSDAAKTRVVMANAATVANHLMVSTDTTGTVGNKTGTAINDGNLQAGRSTVAGSLVSFPSAATTGSLALTAVANSGDYAGVISNRALGQASTWSLPDPVNAAASILVAATATPFTSGNFPKASGTGGLMVDSGYNVDNVLLYASVAVSAAEFNGMYGAPKLLIATPGANKMIVVDRMELVMTFVSAQYASGGVVAAQYDSTVHGAGVLATNTEAAADFTGAAASTVFLFNGAGGDSSQALVSAAADKGLYLSNQTGAFTTGDSTFVVKVHYRIIATP